MGRRGPNLFETVFRMLLMQVVVLLATTSVGVGLGWLFSGGLVRVLAILLGAVALVASVVLPISLGLRWASWNRAWRVAAWVERRLGACSFIWDVVDAEAQDRGLLVVCEGELLFVPYLDGELTDWTEREADIDRLPFSQLLAVETLPARGFREWLQYGHGPLRVILRRGTPLLFEAYGAARAVEALRGALQLTAGTPTDEAGELRTPLGLANSEQLLAALEQKLAQLLRHPARNQAALEDLSQRLAALQRRVGSPVDD